MIGTTARHGSTQIFEHEERQLLKAIGIIAYIVVVCVMAFVLWQGPSIRNGLIAVAIMATATYGLLRYIRGSVKDANDAAFERIKIASEPSKHLASKMTPGEKKFVENRMHPLILLKWWLGYALLTTFVLTYSSEVSVWAWLIGTLILAVRVAFWMRDRTCLTSQAVVALMGILSYRTPSMPLSRITDLDLQVPWHSNVLAKLRVIRTEYGTIILESAGQDQPLRERKFVKDVIPVHRLIRELTRKK